MRAVFFCGPACCTRKGPFLCAAVQTPSADTVGNETHPLSVYIAGYGAPYGYSTAAPAYGMYSPIINKLEIISKLLWQSKCGSPSRNSEIKALTP